MTLPSILGEGSIEPLGLTINGRRANFSIFAPHATQVILCLFEASHSTPYAKIPLREPTHGIWHVEIETPPISSSYLYLVDNQFLSDPYAKAYATCHQWGDFSIPKAPHRCQIAPSPSFDWQNIQSPRIPRDDLIIYEMHVRGFTAHSSSQVKTPGTYAGVIEKIDYLKSLNINAVELMPIFEFDETHSPKIFAATHENRINYWGYNPISFFVPMNRYAHDMHQTVNEFKTMIRELHRAGIEIILDVVFNHTGEDTNYAISFRGLDLNGYFMVDALGNDRNYTGCGNTFQTNGSMGQKIIIDSLRYWVEEMHVDGFRFDLAAIFTRGCDGQVLNDPPLLKAIAQDSVLKNIKLIAEPWDAAMLSQVGQFHRWGHWIEWNGSYRDHVRRFMIANNNETGAFAASLSGSAPTFPSGTPQSGINFITAHDGFCLRDLVTYQHKHNIDNAENNRDGSDHNYNWNCGAEGPTQDPQIHELRERQMRNFWIALFLSQGIPMFLMGDEIGHTRKGNNNPYIQDNDINWFNWAILQKNQSMKNFISSLITFRKTNDLVRKKKFLTDDDIEWHGHFPLQPDWSSHSHFIAYTLKGIEPLYIAFNADVEQASVVLPHLPNNKKWRVLINTAQSWDQHNLNDPKNSPSIEQSIELLPHSALVLCAFK